LIRVGLNQIHELASMIYPTLDSVKDPNPRSASLVEPTLFVLNLGKIVQ